LPETKSGGILGYKDEPGDFLGGKLILNGKENKNQRLRQTFTTFGIGVPIAWKRDKLTPRKF